MDGTLYIRYIYIYIFAYKIANIYELDGIVINIICDNNNNYFY